MPSTENKHPAHSIYGRFLAEREEILRFKWLESERAGHDVGFEHALTTWTLNHRPVWREKQQSAQVR